MLVLNPSKRLNRKVSKLIVSDNDKARLSYYIQEAYFGVRGHGCYPVSAILITKVFMKGELAPAQSCILDIWLECVYYALNFKKVGIKAAFLRKLERYWLVYGTGELMLHGSGPLFGYW